MVDVIEAILDQYVAPVDQEKVRALLTQALPAQSAELEALRGEVERLKDERDEQALLYAKTLEQWVALRARNAALEEFTTDVSACLGDLLCDEEIGEPDPNEDPLVCLLRRSRALLEQNGEAG